MTILLQQLVLGLLLGGLYGLAAAGLSLIFGVLKVLNVAHGDLIMIGGYAAFWLAGGWGLDPFAALLVVVPLTAALGLVLYQGLFSFVVRFHEETRIKNSLLISFGLVLVLQAMAVRFFTADERTISTTYSLEALTIGTLRIPIVRLAGFVVAVVAALALEWMMSRTRFGRALRATSEDWTRAALTGIDVRRVYLVAFAISAALAGIAGSVVSLGYSVSPSIGLEWTLKALIVVVLAGLGSVFGTFLGGVLLGVAEATSVLFIGGAYREVVGLVLFVLVLLVRPSGLFGRTR